MVNFSQLYLGIFSLFISFLSFINILYCYYFDLILDTSNFFFVFLISFFFGTLIFFKKKINHKVSIYEKILTVILGYILIPVILAIPYYLSINNLNFFDSYFEAVSGFTSTGFTIFENIKHLNESLILWRSSTQWVGGLYFLISLIMLINIFDFNLKKSLTNFISFSSDETLKQSFKISIIYIIMTILIFILLSVSGIRIFNSFNLSFTLISSGGFLPDNNLNLIISNKFQEITLSILMLISFFSLFIKKKIKISFLKIYTLLFTFFS